MVKALVSPVKVLVQLEQLELWHVREHVPANCVIPTVLGNGILKDLPDFGSDAEVNGKVQSRQRSGIQSVDTVEHLNELRFVSVGLLICESSGLVQLEDVLVQVLINR